MSTPPPQGPGDPGQGWTPPQPGPHPHGPQSQGPHPPGPQMPGPQWQGPPPPWPPPPQIPPNTTGIVVGMAFAGMAVYSVVNAVLGFAIFVAAMEAEGGSGITLVIVGAVFLALLGLGAGLGLLLVRKPWTKGLGMGLMIGWALWSILSAGLCTGVNPALYGF
jgi:hypothetical protein